LLWFAVLAIGGAAARADATPSLDEPSPPPVAPQDSPLIDDLTYEPSWAPYEPLPGATSDSRVALLEARVADLENTLACRSQTTDAPKELSPVMAAGWGPNGFEAISANKDFRVHIGGRVQVDAVALNAHDLVLGGVGDDDAVDFRRGRFRVDGDIYHCHSWAVEFDFVNAFNVEPDDPSQPVTANGGNVVTAPALTDLWWAVSELPWIGNVRIGNQKDSIGLEHLTSSRFLDFLERSYLQDAFYGPFNNGFAPGVAVFDWNEAETMTYNLGGYKNTQNPFGYDVGDNEYMLTGRVTWLPYVADEGARLVHLGCGCRYAGFDQDAPVADGNARIRSRASLRNGAPSGLQPNLADTNFAGRLFVDNQVLVAPELAVVLGSLDMQAEYVGGFFNSTTFTPLGGAPTNVGQVFYQGTYVQAMYFITGEHRDYIRREARWNRVTPLHNFGFRNGCNSGWGAWQIGARYGFLDLNDAGIDGGYIQDFTVGLNWFWNPFSKLQFNYIYQGVHNTQRNAAGVITAENDGNLQGFGVRFAFDF